MVTFPSPKPETETAEHPRGSPAWITAYPSQKQIDGRPPIDQPPTIESLPPTDAGTRNMPGAPGLPEMPTAPNTGSRSLPGTRGSDPA